MGSVSTMNIDNQVPYGPLIYWWCHRLEQQSSTESPLAQHEFDRAYLAWETVRRIRNPFFEEGTGFEGYFVGLCREPEDVLARFIQIGHQLEDNIARLYRYSWRFRRRLFGALTADIVDEAVLHEWAVQLGATVARLRCNIIHNAAADVFHNETYRYVNFLPPIEYHMLTRDHNIRQHFVITGNGVEGLRRLKVSVTQLPSADQEAWIIMRFIGKFGHPLIRQFVRMAW